MLKVLCSIPAAILLGAYSSAAFAAGLAASILSQVPRGYTVLASAVSPVRPTHTFYFVALASKDEARSQDSGKKVPARPLLIFERRADGRYALIARNDEVIFRADDGGINGCDPFEGRAITTKGNYVTIEQGVACGEHWTDYVTFRFNPAAKGYVFDNWRTQSWSIDSSKDANADALVSHGQRVVRAKGRPVPFAKWRRPTR